MADVKDKLGSLTFGSWRYKLTETDILWAGRMVEGETLPGQPQRERDALAVLWTMASLFSPAGQQAKYGRRRYHTFAEQIRAYSQPINPAWTETGRFCRPGGSYHGTDYCSADRLAHRAALQRRPWSEITPELRAVVVAWAKGETENPVPMAMEFAAASVANRFIERNPGATTEAVIQNTFVATADSKRWEKGPKVEPVSGGVSGIAVAAVAAAAGGLLGWLANRSGSKGSP